MIGFTLVSVLFWIMVVVLDRSVLNLIRDNHKRMAKACYYFAMIAPIGLLIQAYIPLQEDMVVCIVSYVYACVYAFLW